MTVPDWKDKDLGLIREACRHGESRLAAQVTIATSADQRSSVFAGFYVAAGVGILGAVLTGSEISGDYPLICGAISVALVFLFGAYLCVRATLPVKFWLPGNDPRAWYEDIEEGRDLRVAIGQQAAYFDKHIRENEETLRKNAGLFKVGALLGIFSPVIGFAVVMIVRVLLAIC